MVHGVVKQCTVDEIQGQVLWHIMSFRIVVRGQVVWHIRHIDYSNMVVGLHDTVLHPSQAIPTSNQGQEVHQPLKRFHVVQVKVTL